MFHSSSMKMSNENSCDFKICSNLWCSMCFTSHVKKTWVTYINKLINRAFLLPCNITSSVLINCTSNHPPVSRALGKLHRPRVPPEEGDGKLLEVKIDLMDMCCCCSKTSGIVNQIYKTLTGMI